MNQPTLHPKLNAILNEAITRNASDVHIGVGKPPIFRVDGKMMAAPIEEILTSATVEEILWPLLTVAKHAEMQAKRDIDFSFGYSEVRFRVNYFYERGVLAGAFRIIPNKIRSIRELNLPPIVEGFINHSQGFVIVTGPTGHGKSTSLAAMIDSIVEERAVNVVTLEDPIEFLFQHKKGLVFQREVGSDVTSFARGLRAALREDPDVVLIGEMRDTETIDTALTVAETGHLVLTTLHSNSAAQTAERIVSVFPEYQQVQVRQQLAATLIGVIAQRLIPRINGGRILAVEIMVANSAVRTTIREGKFHLLDNVITTSAAEGMISLDKVIAAYVAQGEISMDNALLYAKDPKALKSSIY